MAVGAQASNIVQLVMGQGLKIVGLGLAAGLCISVLIVRFINSLLYGVSGNDSVTLGLTILVLTLTGGLACLLPAWRAVNQPDHRARE